MAKKIVVSALIFALFGCSDLNQNSGVAERGYCTGLKQRFSRGTQNYNRNQSMNVVDRTDAVRIDYDNHNCDAVLDN
ncbi:MAG: hypothetical protein KKE11_02480 [Gammaproteobacteria bacterium]|nr:hypothetical protein [Gammaproteobacteria bacterium]